MAKVFLVVTNNSIEALVLLSISFWPKVAAP